VETTVAELKAKIGNEKVILGLSGERFQLLRQFLLHQKAIGETFALYFRKIMDYFL